ncbi:hypothetical protein [Streptomyces sp. NPDC050416]|uniref:hypothetical protein n=1 Tax=Streptomyces sp. NPDC050416 TaxID=3365611 RepID=UPI0037BA415F
MYDGLDEIAPRFPSADLTVLHLGGTHLPGGFLVTTDGAQGAEISRRLDSGWSCPSTTATTR